ncbi:hypothetical protein pb186bvf_011950 [Paramecium bursaria]
MNKIKQQYISTSEFSFDQKLEYIQQLNKLFQGQKDQQQIFKELQNRLINNEIDSLKQQQSLSQKEEEFNKLLQQNPTQVETRKMESSSESSKPIKKQKEPKVKKKVEKQQKTKIIIKKKLKKEIKKLVKTSKKQSQTVQTKATQPIKKKIKIPKKQVKTKPEKVVKKKKISKKK